MRIAAAVVGGLGALVGAAKGILSAGGWLFVGLMMDDLTNRVSLLLIGTEGATAIFSILGLVGAGRLLAGTRLGTGTLLMLVGAVGVVVSVATYPLLLSVLMAPIVNATGRPVDYPSAG